MYVQMAFIKICFKVLRKRVKRKKQKQDQPITSASEIHEGYCLLHLSSHTFTQETY